MAGTFACTLPTTPPPTDILEKFSVVLQNPEQPIVHNKIMRMRANGDDEHLVLAPMGFATGDTLRLKDGLLEYRDINPIHGVIDLEVCVCFHVHFLRDILLTRTLSTLRGTIPPSSS